MRSTCKICFFVSLITIVCSTFSLLRADMHEGTGHLMGKYSCGECKDGGSSCDGPNPNTCCSTPACEKGDCQSDCPGTAGEYCHQDDQAGEMCKDDSQLCADSTRPKCVEYEDQFGYMEYKCSDTQTETADCGDTYNTCPTP